QFDDVGKFSHGLAKVNIEEKWGYINKSGQMVISPQFDHAGKVLSYQTNTTYPKVGKAWVKVGDKWGYISLPLND
ncbi:MAG: WG repeat-containing protein, partial [Cyanobacteria bacterium J06628_3]